MRSLNRTFHRIGVFLLASLCMVMTPLVAAAASLEAVPHVGLGPLFVTVAAAGLGIGAVINLRAKDATGNRKTFSLDTEKPEQVAETIDQYAELRAAEASEPIQAKLKAAETESTALRDVIVGEILRIRKLTAPKSEGGEAKFDLEAEKKYLEGLPAERLRMEFDRMPAREDVKLTSATTGGEPEDGADPYANARA